ncbi:hypothetical protein ACN0IV_12910 [Trabulsiella odontotermitis]|uniref:hypothetical protein n=1 Tax=Trabulsiella odontotermitis TaxID=379893 RepID=UPI003AC89838
MITHKDDVFYCDCGFSWLRGKSGKHDCEEGLRKRIAELEARCVAMAWNASPDYFAVLVEAARQRADKAMRNYPQPNYVLNKVAEESGEVIKEVIHYTEGRGDWSKVEHELIDNLAMLIRLVTEGDGVIGFTPPESVIATGIGIKSADA